MPASEEPVAAVAGTRRRPGVLPCKDKKSAPGKKLVQARLPFKRLNPVPKEKAEGVSDIKKVKSSLHVNSWNSLPKLDTSVEALDQDCQLDPEIASPPPKIQNGKGPLDQFLKRRTDLPGLPAVTIDLTDDSNSAHFDNGCSEGPNTDLQKEIPIGTMKPVQITQKLVALCQINVSDVSVDSDAVVAQTVACMDVSSVDQKRFCSSGLEDEGLTMSQENRALIFQGKKPVVVLEDIMISKPSLMGPTQGSVVLKGTSDEEEEQAAAVQSPEVKSISPVSSASGGSSPLDESSPEVGRSPAARGTQENSSCISPSSLMTPVRKIPQKIRPSSEKRKKEQEEKKKKLQAEKEERDRLKEEAKNARERAKEEAKKKKDEEKELKDKERKEKRDKEEQEKREKKEKEDKDKAEKLRLKEEKRKEKQDALEAKLEEKRKKEEEKRVKDEEKRIKAGKSEITRFFQKPKTPYAPKTFASFCGKFAPFEIKKNMALAPLCRVDFDQIASDQLDELLQSQITEGSYLQELKCRKARKWGRTVVHHHLDPATRDVFVVGNGETDDVQDMPDDPLNEELLVEDIETMENIPERKGFGRMKLLQFSENHRPAYWGTWNKESGVIHPRKPWLKDEKILDYELDSDEEWEEEEPGESLSHSEGDDDDEAGEDEEDDDGFFVPHGYLSDNEGAAEEERVDPENQKVRQKLKAKEWDELVSEGKKFRVLKPLVIGCVWESNGASRELKALQRFAACILESVLAEEELAQEKCEKRNIKDQQILAKLLPLLHGNFNASKVIIQEFQECCRHGLLLDESGPVNPENNGASPTSPNTSRPHTPTAGENAAIPSKARLKRIISENSTYEKRPDVRMCWYVHAEVLKRFDKEALPVPCQWTYLTQVNSALKEDSSNSLSVLSAQTTPVSVKRKSSGSMSITKFMKRQKEVKQVGVVESDGFQADTEDEDDCCIIVDPHRSTDKTSASSKISTGLVESSPSGGSTVSLSNVASSEMLDSECAMEIVPSESFSVSTKSVKTFTSESCMVSSNCKEKAVHNGDAMDTVPSDGTICTGCEKTVTSGNAIVALTTLNRNPMIDNESKNETVCSCGTGATGACIKHTNQYASSAGTMACINSAVETVPNTGAMISIPNEA
ncbi:chromatin assembly factor 1 subunit A [Ambystoma mexicanum]|uniref:chromatin assembly factor 1 subunit A n=1 Tax=Ambystoma mexicanum TaxID=8296 RepID=UPI0037E839A3